MTCKAAALIAVLLATTLVPESAMAQTGATAQIGGTVRDESGGVLPGVTVTATQTDTGVSRETQTDADGAYLLTNMPIGPYRLEAGLAGFRSFVQTGIVLQVNANPTINVVLALGAVSEQVTVQGNAAMVETRTTSVGQVMENQRILELPLNGRQVTDLMLLSLASRRTATPGGRQLCIEPQLSDAGDHGCGRFAGQHGLPDGRRHAQRSGDESNLPVPFPDALQEFKVETSALSARYGQHAAAVVNVATKAVPTSSTAVRSRSIATAGSTRRTLSR